MTKARRFNDNDWMGLSGAQPFADASDPWHRDLTSGLEMLADAMGIYAYSYDSETDTLSEAHWYVHFPTAEAAELMLNSIDDKATLSDLEKLGFEIDHNC